MSFGRPSFIATTLLGRTLADKVSAMRSATQTYGSTSGPFGGIGGSAMTTFTITEFRFGGCWVYFADDRFVGWTCRSLDAAVKFPHIDASDLQADPTTCPVPLLDFASARYADAKSRIGAALAMGIAAESDDPNLEAIVSTITSEQVEWIAAWLAGEGIS